MKTPLATLGVYLVADRRSRETALRRGVREWPFGLPARLEVVWGDGAKIDRQIIPTTDLPAFGKKRFQTPFDVSGKKWVRFAAWVVATKGAFVQPIRLVAATTTTTSR